MRAASVSEATLPRRKGLTLVLTAHISLSRLSLPVTAAALLAAAVPASAQILDFEAPGPGANFSSPPGYSEDGYTFLSSVSRDGAFRTQNVTGGSVAMATMDFSAITTLTRTDAGLFNVTSIDLAELVEQQGPPRNVTFNGLVGGSTVVSQTVTYNGIPGPETFALTGFTGIEALQWQQGFDTLSMHVYDNIVVSPAAAGAAPEPGTLALAGIALLSGAAYRRKREI